MCVCVRYVLCVKEKSSSQTDTVSNIQTHNQKKAKEGKQAKARHPGGTQGKDTQIFSVFINVLLKVKEQKQAYKSQCEQ